MRRVAVVLLLIALVAWGVWSFEAGGLVRILAVGPGDGSTRVDAIREYVLAWGALAPLVYVTAVTVEVLVAPFPGALLYAPGGAIFGGFIGGTLALIGNVLGAAIAAVLARALGEKWVARHVSSPKFARVRERLARNGGWVVFVLRINPLTSADFVSYAAGAAGVPARSVAIGTLFGMAPQCYLQAYLAERFFAVVSGWWMLAILTAAAVVVLAMILRGRWRDDASRLPDDR